MYKRSYYDIDGTAHDLPEQGYDGTALQKSPPRESPLHTKAEEDEPKRETKISPSESHADTEACVSTGNEKGGFGFGRLLGGFGLQNIIPFHLPKRLEFEDLLLIGIAVYLLLSKSGDKECALLLAALVFIGQ